MKRKSVIAIATTWNLAALALIAGCAMPPAMTPGPQQPADPASTVTGEAPQFALSSQQTSEGLPGGWTQQDIETLQIFLTDSAGRLVTTVTLSPQADPTPLKAKFEHLRLGETYRVTILAMKGDTVLNSRNPLTESFVFTGEQDVENLLIKTVTVKLDDGRFSGTVTIPLSEGLFDDDHNQHSKWIAVRLFEEKRIWRRKWFPTRWEEDLVTEEVFTQTYERPRTGNSPQPYRDFKLHNLGFDRRYHVKLVSYKNILNMCFLSTRPFVPFETRETTTFRIPASQFMNH